MPVPKKAPRVTERSWKTNEVNVDVFLFLISWTSTKDPILGKNKQTTTSTSPSTTIATKQYFGNRGSINYD